MFNDEKLSRRSTLKIALSVIPMSIGGAALLNACGSESEGLDCTDVSGLSGSETATRTALEYVEASPHGEEKDCTNCNFYTGTATACGACTLIKGPINPKGYCKSWVVKA